MYWNEINKNCVVGFLPQLESLFAVHSLLLGEDKDEFCKKVFGDELIREWKRKYRFLFDTTEAAKDLKPNGMLEYCSDIDISKLTLDELECIILKLPKEVVLHQQFGFGKHERITLEDIELALSNEQGFHIFYQKIEESCPNYLGISSLFKGVEQYVKEYFALARELSNSLFLDEIASFDDTIKNKMKELMANIIKLGPMEYSEYKMGKTFYNRGPYKKYVFLLSVFSPYRCVRFFVEDLEFKKAKEKQQLFFESLHQKEKSRDKTITALKALSDKSRYEILALLSEKGPIHGREIGKALSIAPSTVSHHMELLKECELVTEEQVRTSKYYGINKRRIAELLQDMGNDFKGLQY